MTKECSIADKIPIDEFDGSYILQKIKDMLRHHVESLSCIDLGDEISDAITKEAGIENHLTYATKDNQFKLDKGKDGKWYITSELVAYGRGWSDYGEKQSVIAIMESLKADIALVEHLKTAARHNDIWRYLE
jgi:hypothetical protein